MFAVFEFFKNALPERGEAARRILGVETIKQRNLSNLAC